jgi:hypothetical protein
VFARLARIRLLAVAIAAVGFALPARAVWREVGVSAALARWKLADGETGSQVGSVAHAEWARGGSWEARLELSGTRTARGESRLSARPGVAALVRFRPHAQWLLQAGLRSPGWLDDLDGAQLALARAVGEPLLGLPEPEPVHGLRLHAGVVRGLALAYDWHVLLAAGVDRAGAVDVTADAPLETGTRATVAATLEATRGAHRLQVEFQLAREGEERLAEEVIRSAHTFAAGEARLFVHLPPVRGRCAVGLASTGRTTLPDREVFARAREEGPAWLGRASLELRPAAPRAWEPVLALGWSRLMPGNLPLADGWSLRVEPGVSRVWSGRELFLRAAWTGGRLRPAEFEGLGARERLTAWTISTGVRWWPGGGE